MWMQQSQGTGVDVVGLSVHDLQYRRVDGNGAKVGIGGSLP